MAGSTPLYGFRYPTITDSPDVPRDVKNLAQDVETKCASIDSDRTTRKSIKLTRTTSNYTFGVNTWTQMSFNTVPLAGTGGLVHNSGASVTLPSDGVYAVSCAGRSSATGYFEICIADATTLTPGTPQNARSFDGGSGFVQGTCAITDWFLAGTSLSMYVYSSLGVVVNHANFIAHLTVVKLPS